MAVAGYEVSYYDNRTPLVSSTPLVRSLLDIVNRQVSQHKLLAGSRIFYEDLLQPNYAIDTEQLLSLVHNAQRHSKMADLPFRLGRRLHTSAQSQLLQAMRSSERLIGAIDCLCHFSQLYLPQFTIQQAHRQQPYQHQADATHFLIFNDAIGLDKQQRFLTDLLLSSIVATFKQLNVDTQRWRIYLPYEAPSILANHQEFLADQLIFNAPLATIALPADQLQQTLPETSPLAKQHALQQCQREANQSDRQIGFIAYVMQQLHLQLGQQTPCLDSCAASLGMSSSTLKRRLKQHHCHFQKLLDQVRSQHALYYLHIQGCSNDITAKHLYFNDTTNFRRSFKRWTGGLPSQFKALPIT